MKSLLVLNPFFYRYKWHLISGFFFVSISVWFGIIPAQFVRESFDSVEESIRMAQEDEHFLSAELKLQLLRYGLIIIGAALLKGIFMFFMRQTIIVMSRHIEFDLKNKVYEHYQKLSPSFYRRNSTGDLMNRISEDVSRVRMYIGPAIMYGINVSVLLIIVIYYMLSINVRLTIFTLLPLPILSVLIYKVSRMINRRSEQVQAQLSSISTFVQETLAGVRVLKALVKEKYLEEKFEGEADTYFQKNEKLYRVNALFGPLMLLLIGMSTLLTIYVGGLEAIKGNITTGNIAEFIFYVNMLTWPVASIGWVTSIVQRAAASQKRINEFLDTPSDIVNPTEEERVIKGEVQFKNVSFVYPDTGIMALDSISFEVKPGETLAILGQTGSGKSTVSALTARFFDPTEGEVLIDGIPLNQLNLSQYREQISMVPQDNFLFSTTIAENIAFGQTDADHNEIIKAAQIAGLHENIMNFPKGYETRLGERGVTLSGGQKQRTSLARALLKNPRILILDDCLSAVDTETEERILRVLRDYSKDITTLIISHRVSSVKHADKIIVLDQGKIVEEGSHDQLIRSEGYYANIHQKQLVSGEF